MPNACGAADAARESASPILRLAPKDQLYRADPRLILRADDEGDGRTLEGHFSVFDQWTEIDSWYEGQFMERVAKGAYRKTFKEQRDQLRVLLQHGMDPELGDRPIGEIVDLREDDVGAFYSVRLFDGVPPLVMDGLRAGQYGASFRFSVMREEWVEEPGASDHNPKGLPERTLKEVSVREFGPVTWGAYPEATAGLRALSDEVLVARATRDPDKLRTILDYLEKRDARQPAGEAGRDDETSAAADEARGEGEREPPGDAPTAPAVQGNEATAAPERGSTPLFTGRHEKGIAAPGVHPTPLYTGKRPRKGWAL